MNNMAGFDFFFFLITCLLHNTYIHSDPFSAKHVIWTTSVVTDWHKLSGTVSGLEALEKIEYKIRIRSFIFKFRLHMSIVAFF